MKRIIVVLGMHRSGTSAVARGLEVLGVSLGNNLIPPNFDNVKGFWEDREITALNEELQKLLGYDWFGAEALRPIDWTDPRILACKDSARSLLTEKAKHVDIFGFKDPRTAVLLEFWKAVFSEADFVPAYVVTLRSPVEVAKSLEVRNGLPLTRSLYLWVASLLASLEFTSGARRVVVSYSNMLENPKTQLARIQLALGIESRGDDEQLTVYASNFLEPRLQHHSDKGTALPNASGCPAVLGDLYELALDLANDRERFDSDAYADRLAKLKKNQSTVLPALGLLVSEHSMLLQSYRAVEQLRSNVANLESECGRLGREKAALSEALQHVESELKRLTPEAERMRGELARSQYDLSAANAQNSALAEALKGRDAEFQQLMRDFSQRNLRLQESEARSREESARHEQVAGNLRSRIEELELHSLGLTAECNRLRGERDALRKSYSWRVTAPLRFALDWLVLRPIRTLGRFMERLVEWIWRLVPGSTETKRLVKRVFFTVFRFPLKYTRFYRDWVEFEKHFRAPVSLKGSATPDTPFELEFTGRAYVERTVESVPTTSAIRLIAFYLPQFHPIPENDEWWGKGFTEWTNVRPASPQYKGHYQPHVPGELGYYDLRDPEVQRKQVELAKAYGLGGFCFYFYWFDGKRLLERPVLNYLQNEDIDFPFCLCWANENWSRTWDGLDNELLIAQNHCPEDDLAFISYVSRYFRDERYIRVHGRPVLVVYRPALLPNPVETAARWREWCRASGVGEIYLVSTHSFEAVDPGVYGFDAALEFPPNNTAPAVITDEAPGADPEFKGIIYDWTSIAQRSREYADPGYKLFRGVNPAWDNTARRKNRGAIFAGSTPAGYEEWLRNAAQDTLSRFAESSERLVFVNAWNEWAEGAHLEPDQAYGYAYLEATRKALGAVAPASTEARRILLVAHDAHPHGAQNLILHMAKTLAEDFHCVVDMVVLGDGPLLEKYAEYATIHSMAGKDPRGLEAQELAIRLRVAGFASAICNTTVAGLFVETLKKAGFRVVSLIHELPEVIRSYDLESHVATIAEYADTVVFPAHAVREGFKHFTDVPDEKVALRPQGVYKRNRYQTPADRRIAARELRSRFRIPMQNKVVLCAGYADHRKGIDLFVEIGLKVLRVRDDVSFLWLGHWDTNLEEDIKTAVSESGHREHFVFPGIDFDTDVYFAGADLYALTSREDPFPSVVMEALDVAVPVVAFAGAGGFTELLERGCGRLAPAFDTDAYAGELLSLLGDAECLERLGSQGQKIVHEEYSFRHYLFDLLDMAHIPLKRVSVIVPNYNYANYIEARLASISEQTYPVYELIVLDDASTDASVQTIDKLVSGMRVDHRVVLNSTNSGSVFRQWAKGIELARGDYLWIAEADDLADDRFMEVLSTAFEDPGVVMSYCESRQIDDNGSLLAENYNYYLRDISESKWRRNYVVSGEEELTSALAIKNTILNVSAVLFKRSAIASALHENMDEVLSYRFAGDWILYSHILEKGKIAFFSEALNTHRRHDKGVTISGMAEDQLVEILRVQRSIRDRHQLDTSVERKAHDFAQNIYEQFGLAGEYRSVEANPNFTCRSAAR